MENLSPTNENTYDTIVVGGGISGLTAGIYTARAAQKTLIIEGDYNSSIDMPGGQLILTPEIENFPGFKGGGGMGLVGTVRKKIADLPELDEGTGLELLETVKEQVEAIPGLMGNGGFDLIEIVKEQAEDNGCEIITANAVGFDLAGNTLHSVTTNYGETYYAKSIILATGAVARRLGVTGEDEFYGRGVSACATCDGAFFKGKKVAVVGGGDTAVEDALYMADLAEEVILIHRRDELRSDGPESRKLMEAKNVRVIWNSTVKSIEGSDNKVDHVVLTHMDGTESTLDVSALFVAIGHDPATKHFHGVGVEVRGDMYLVERDTYTNIPGVFAAGDVADSIYRQAITAAASGAKAGMNAIKYNKTS